MSSALRTGEVVDRYTVEHLLGEGGMAAVYAVRHNTLGSKHAFKLLKVENDAIRRRLVAEGQVQASLRHPNIVAVTDVLFVRGQPGLLMEKIDGPSVEEWLEEEIPNVEDSLRLFRGIVAGVARAHRSGLVHRDLKPGNVLLDSADGLIIPKVADFGLAKILADEEGGHSQTRTGFAMGTPQYMAPEQIRSAKDVDVRADVFALGCILYRLVTGRMPFDNPDMLALFNAIAQGEYTPPEEIVPDLPKRVADTIRGCLMVDREKRLQTCEELRICLYGAADENLSGGVRIANPVVNRVRAPIPLVAGETRLPTGVDVSIARPKRPDATLAPSSAATFGMGALAAGGVAAVIGAVALAIVAGFLWWRDGKSKAQVVPAPVAVTSPGTGAPVEKTNTAPAVTPPEEKPVETPQMAVTSHSPPQKPQPAAGSSGAHRTEKPVKPAPTPTETVPGGSWSVSGEVASITLTGGGRSWTPGKVPAGTYELAFTFADGAPRKGGSVRVGAGDSVHVVCNTAFANCAVK